MARAAVDNEMTVTSKAVTSVTRQLSQVNSMSSIVCRELEYVCVLVGRTDSMQLAYMRNTA